MGVTLDIIYNIDGVDFASIADALLYSIYHELEISVEDDDIKIPLSFLKQRLRAIEIYNDHPDDHGYYQDGNELLDVDDPYFYSNYEGDGE